MAIGEAAKSIATSRRSGKPEPLAVPDDVMLVQAAREHPQAFGSLYDRYVESVFAYCLRRLGHPETAADATSQIFTNALQALPKFRIDKRRAGSSFRSWLFSIAHNVVIDQYRGHRDHRSYVPELHDTADGAALPEERAIAAERSDRLYLALARLPDIQRAIVELRLAGLKRAEIATILEMTDPAVRSAQTRAFERLRDLLTDPQEQPDANP